MIDQADIRLKAWVEGILTGVTVSMALPPAAQELPAVSLYLLALADPPAPLTNNQSALQLTLCYLVTTWSSDLLAAHHMLGNLVFAAMQAPEFRVDLQPLPAETWAALGTPPRPSFILRLPLKLDLPKTPPQLVRQPLVIDLESLVDIQGIVLGPGDIPLADALVEIPDSPVSTRTGADGRFKIKLVLGKTQPGRLHVVARGHEMLQPIEAAQVNEPLVIRFQSFD